jgi:hypothetical protein
MTASPATFAAITALCLEPATLAVMLRSIRDAMPQRGITTDADRDNQRDAVLGRIAILAPRDPNEAMLVAQIIITEAHAVDCYTSAARADQLPAMIFRFRAQGASLARLSTNARRELAKNRAAAVNASVQMGRATMAAAAVVRAEVAAAAQQQPLKSSQPAAPPPAAPRQDHAAPTGTRPGSGGFVAPTPEELACLVAERDMGEAARPAAAAAARLAA